MLVTNMSTESVLKENDICPACHTLMSDTHTCIDDNIICPRFYTPTKKWSNVRNGRKWNMCI